MRWAGLLLLCSCAPAIELDLSAVAGARTVVALQDDGMFVSWSYVFDVEDGAAFEMPYPPELITLVYAPRSPADLGVTPGLQPLADGSGKTLLELGFDKQRVWRAGTWAEANLTRLTSSTRLRVAAPVVSTPCPAPKIESVVLTSSAAYARPIAMGGFALVVTDLGQAYRVDADRRVTRLGLVPAGEGGVQAAGAYAGGALWLGVGSCLERFTLEDDVLRGGESVCTSGGQVTFVDTRDGATFAVQTTYGTSLLRAGRAPEPLGDVAFGNLAIAPDGTVVSGANRVITTLSPSGQRSTEPVEIVAEFIAEVEWVEGRGMMLGDSGGFVMSLVDHRWEPVGDPGFFYGVNTFAPWRDGFVVSGGTAEGARYVDGHGFCPLTALGPSGAMVPLGKGLLLSGQRHSLSTMIEATWLDFEPD